MKTVNRLNRIETYKIFLVTLFFASNFHALHAQCKFKIGNGDDVDTVCVNEPVVIYDYSGVGCGTDGITPHLWSYQDASITVVPTFDTVKTPAKQGVADIITIDDAGKYYLFAASNRSKPQIIRYFFNTSFTAIPAVDTLVDLSTYSDSLAAFSIKYDSDSAKWYVLAIVGTYNEEDTGRMAGRLIRLTMGSGLNAMPSKIENLGSYGNSFKNVGDFSLYNDNGHWYGFVANQFILPTLTFIDFTTGLGGDSASIKVEQLILDNALFGGSRNGITGIAPYKNGSEWSVIGVNKDLKKFIRISSDDNFYTYNTTLVNDLNKTLSSPYDIMISNDCNQLIGTFLNHNSRTYNLIFFQDIAKDKNYEVLPMASISSSSITGMSEPHRVPNNIFSFFANTNGQLIRMKYNNDSVSHTVPATPVNNLYAPATFMYKDTGYYTVTLTVNGITTCRKVLVITKPSKPEIVVEPNFCTGDTIILAEYKDNAKYNWIFPDLTTESTTYPTVKDSGMHVVDFNYDMCFSRADSQNLKVSDYPFSPKVNDVYACPGTVSEIKIGNMRAKDSLLIYTYNPDTGISFPAIIQKYNPSEYIVTFNTPPTDTSETVYHYYVVRKPADAGNCPFDRSKSVFQQYIVQRPTPPFVNDTVKICAPGDDARVEASGSDIRWYADPNLVVPLTPYDEPVSFYVPKPTELTQNINKFFATQFIGCESKAAEAVVQVFVPGPPTLTSNHLHGCVNDPDNELYPAFIAHGSPGATYNWYKGNILVQSDGLGFYSHGFNANSIGADTIYVSQTVVLSGGSSCTSQKAMGTLAVYYTGKPEDYFIDNTVYACTNYPKTELRLKPESGIDSTKWYLSGNLSVVIHESRSFTPSVANIDSQYVYIVRQLKNNCWSKFDTITYKTLVCQPYPKYTCETLDSLNLFDVANVPNKVHHWQDNNYTGQLVEPTVGIEGLELNKIYYFQYQRHLVILTVEKQYSAGDANFDTSFIACTSPINLFDAIINYDNGGVWFDKNNKNLTNSIIEITPNKQTYTYKISTINMGCPMDSIIVPVWADTNLSIKCIVEKNIFLDEGEETYRVPDKTLDATPLVKESDCQNYSMYFIFDDSTQVNESTLADRMLVEGHHTVKWVATNNFTKNPVYCITRINITPIFITNLFTPNGDGYNDTWILDLRKYPENHVRLYSRWGQLVFESKNIEQIEWDGNDKSGKQYPSDGYMYIISSGDKIISKGTVTLMR